MQKAPRSTRKQYIILILISTETKFLPLHEANLKQGICTNKDLVYLKEYFSKKLCLGIYQYIPSIQHYSSLCPVRVVLRLQLIPLFTGRRLNCSSGNKRLSPHAAGTLPQTLSTAGLSALATNTAPHPLGAEIHMKLHQLQEAQPRLRLPTL